MRVAFSVGLLLISTRVFAASPVCEKLEAGLDLSVKKTALALYGGLSDTSAPRATMRFSEASVQAQVTQNHLTAMQMHNCAAPSVPVSPSDYTVAVMRCEVERMRGNEDAVRAACGSLKTNAELTGK